MGIFTSGSYPTSGGTVITTQDGQQTLSLNGTTLTISGSNSSVNLASFLDDTNTTNSTFTLTGNVLTLTDSAGSSLTADLSVLADITVDKLTIPYTAQSGIETGFSFEKETSFPHGLAIKQQHSQGDYDILRSYKYYSVQTRLQGDTISMYSSDGATEMIRFDILTTFVRNKIKADPDIDDSYSANTNLTNDCLLHLNNSVVSPTNPDAHATVLLNISTGLDDYGFISLVKNSATDGDTKLAFGLGKSSSDEIFSLNSTNNILQFGAQSSYNQLKIESQSGSLVFKSNDNAVPGQGIELDFLQIDNFVYGNQRTKLRGKDIYFENREGEEMMFMTRTPSSLVTIPAHASNPSLNFSGNIDFSSSGATSYVAGAMLRLPNADPTDITAGIQRTGHIYFDTTNSVLKYSDSNSTTAFKTIANLEDAQTFENAITIENKLNIINPNFSTSMDIHNGTAINSGGSVVIGNDAINGATLQNDANPWYTLVGHQVGKDMVASSGGYITAVGAAAGEASNGNYCVYIGNGAGRLMVHGDTARNSNIAIGVGSMYLGLNEQGVAIGHEAGRNAHGLKNVHIGFEAGENMGTNLDNKDDNVVIGYQSGKGAALEQSVIIGNYAGYGSLASTRDNRNTYVGRRAGYEANGGWNTYIGDEAGETVIGDNNTIIGGNAAYNANVTNLGDWTGNVVIGYNAAGVANVGGWTGMTDQNMTNNIIIGHDTCAAATMSDGNTIIGSGLLVGDTDDLSNTVVIGSSSAERLRIDSNGKFKLNGYGSGTHTGSFAKVLVVDSSGEVNERDRGWWSGVSTTTTDLNGEFTLSVASGTSGVTCSQYDSTGTAPIYIFVFKGVSGTTATFKVYDLTGSAVASTSVGFSYSYATAG